MSPELRFNYTPYFFLLIRRFRITRIKQHMAIIAVALLDCVDNPEIGDKPEVTVSAPNKDHTRQINNITPNIPKQIVENVTNLYQ